MTPPQLLDEILLCNKGIQIVQFDLPPLLWAELLYSIGLDPDQEAQVFHKGIRCILNTNIEEGNIEAITLPDVLPKWATE